MKKWKLLFVSLLSIALVACSTDNEGNEKKEESNQAVEVDKGIFNVEVTLPASLFEGEDIDETITQMKEDGVKEVIKNDDGSLTLKMSKSEHEKLMDNMEAQMKEFVKEMETSEDFTSIQKVEHNKAFDEFTITVDKAAYENSFDGFALLGLAIQTLYYQLFDGVSEDDYEMTVKLKDAETSEIFETIVYPDALEALNDTDTVE